MGKYIKIDVDGVIRDIVTPMCEIYNRDFGENITPKGVKEYDVSKVFTRIEEKGDMTAADYFFTDLNNSTAIFYSFADLFPGAKTAILKMRAAGHKIVISTWQTTEANKRNTLAWLEALEIQYDAIMFGRDKHILNCDYIIDDNPEFLLDPKETGKKILIRRPYNEYVKDPDIVKVGNLLEAELYICENEKLAKK